MRYCLIRQRSQSMPMNIKQGVIVFILYFGWASSSSPEDNLLLNICFDLGSCRSNQTYLKLTPSEFQPNVYNYTIHIPNDYPFYASTGPMLVEFFVVMNVSQEDGEQGSVAKSVLFDQSSAQVLASSDLAYSHNELLRVAVRLWQSEHQVTTRLVVYKFHDNDVQQSDPYFLTFKRNE